VTVRCRINHAHSELSDGDEVVIHLKDRSKTPSFDEKDWYEKAFGRKRNMQTYTVNYVPLFDAGRRGLCDFFVKLNYRMHAELLEEPDAYKYDKYREIFLHMSGEEQEDDKGAIYYTYSYNLELPNGDWKFSYYYKLRSNETGEKQELPED